MYNEESPGKTLLDGGLVDQDRDLNAAFGALTTGSATHESWHRNETLNGLDNPFEDPYTGGMNFDSRLVRPKLKSRRSGGSGTESLSLGRAPAGGKVKTNKHRTSVLGSFLGSLRRNKRGTGMAVKMPTTELGSPFVFRDQSRGYVVENGDDDEMSIEDAMMIPMPTEDGGQLLGGSADHGYTDPFKTPPRTSRKLSTPRDPRSPLSHTSTKSPRSPMEVGSPESTTRSEKRRKAAKRLAVSRKKKLQILGFEARAAVDGSGMTDAFKET